MEACCVSDPTVGVRFSCAAPIFNMRLLRKYNCLSCNKENYSRQKDVIYCNETCRHDLVYKKYIERWLSGFESGMKGKTSISCHIRRYLFEVNNSECQLCGWNKVSKSTGKIPLEVEHVDGNFRNNKVENLQLICPNCHSLTSTYKSQNKGKGRNRKYYI